MSKLFSEFQEEQLTSESSSAQDVEFLNDVPLQATVELGSTELTIRRLLQLGPGSVIELDKLLDEPFDFRVNGNMVARGEVVVLNENFGIRITQLIDPDGSLPD